MKSMAEPEQPSRTDPGWGGLQGRGWGVSLTVTKPRKARGVRHVYTHTHTHHSLDTLSAVRTAVGGAEHMAGLLLLHHHSAVVTLKPHM